MKKISIFLLLLGFSSAWGALSDTVKSLSKTVNELRALAFKSAVPSETEGKEQVEAYIQRRIDEEYKPEEIDAEQRAMALLDLIPQDFSYRTVIVELLRDQVAGYYDPARKTLIVSQWVEGENMDPVLVHELTHALQDQHFDLSKSAKRIVGNDDATSAVNALIEGDAMSVMVDYGLRGQKVTAVDLQNLTATISEQMAQETKSRPSLKQAPPFLVDTMLFPYVYGLEFVRLLRKNGGWEAVNQAFRNPPQSSEQILHPEKFSPKPEAAVSIDSKVVDSGRLNGGKVVTTNVMGEFGWRAILTSKLEKSEAEAGAAGWGGDRYWLVELDGSRGDIFVAATVWDNEKEAQEFEAYWKKRKATRKSLVWRHKNKAVVSIGLSSDQMTKIFKPWITSS